jgi:hypothetical protein
MWIIKAVFLFLLLWGLWYVCWTLIFAGWDVAHGFAPLPIVIGVIVALLLTGKIMESRRRKKGSF